MRYPKFLNNSKKILFVAPSFGCTTEPYKSRLIKAKEILEKQGFTPQYGDNSFSAVGGRSNTAVLCAKEFMDGYLLDNQLLLSVGGGFLENEILDYIDFNLIKISTPKWFMGYSDNTNLTFTLTTLCDIASIYGYNAPEFGTDELHQSHLDTISLLKGEKLTFEGYEHFELESEKTEENPLVGLNLDTKKVLTKYPNKNLSFKGRLLGGCVDCLTYLIKTPYDKVSEFNQKYKDDGIIWFLEACDLEAWNLRLSLLQMKRCGWFDNAKGFIFGRSQKIDNVFFDIDMHSAIIDVLKDLDVPIVLDCDFGHLKPQIPLICGAYATVEATKNIKIKYELK